MSRARVGWPAVVLVAVAPVHIALVAAAAVVLPAALKHLAQGAPWPIGNAFAPTPTALVTLGLAVTLLALTVSGPLASIRARRLPPGAEGRARWAVLGAAAVTHAVTLIPAAALGVVAVRRVIASGFAMLHPTQLLLSLPNGSEPVFWALVGISMAAFLAMLIAEVACWFLIRDKIRRAIFVAVDVALVAAFVACTWTLPIEPPADAPDAVLGPAVRLTVTALFAMRLALRLTGPLLGLIERWGFRPLVAARHLRSNKSSFLAAIGTLSVLAVAFSSCSLTTTLSVMGGFRQDLQEKILGNHAHIVVDQERGTFEGWDPTLGAIRDVPGVEAAAPYVTGEVMMSSSSNLAGGVLRGIVPGEVGNVLDLEENVVCPTDGERALHYLEHPDDLLDLPPEDRQCGELPLEVSLSRVEAESSDADTPTGSGVAQQLPGLEGPAPSDESPPPREPPDGASAPPQPAPPQGEGPAALPEPPAPQGEGPAALPEPPAPEPGTEPPEDQDVLPGIIVGQELARALRLYVGDVVNVVSPFGSLGPTGPMPKTRPFRVAGIFYSGMYEYDMKYAYVTLPVAQRFLNVGDSINGVEVTVQDLERAPAAAASIRESIERPSLRVQDWQELNKNLFGALALEKLAMFVTLGIAILVAGFCVFGTLTLMVQEKSREVGILKAMGTSSAVVIGLFLIEGVLIGVFGATLGLGLGYLVGFVAKHFQIVPINPEVYYIDKLPVHMDPVDFTLVGIAAVLVCLFATIFPAVLASRMRPVDALRYD